MRVLGSQRALLNRELLSPHVEPPTQPDLKGTARKYSHVCIHMDIYIYAFKRNALVKSARLWNRPSGPRCARRGRSEGRRSVRGSRSNAPVPRADFGADTTSAFVGSVNLQRAWNSGLYGCLYELGGAFCGCPLTRSVLWN